MDEENIQIIDNKDTDSGDGGVAKINGVKTERLEFYAKVTAIATSIIVLAIFSLLLYYIRGTVIIFALAFLVAYILGPAVRFFERRGINRVLIVSLFYIAFVALVIVSVVLLLPVLWGEMKGLQVGIQNGLSDPELGERVKATLQSLQDRFAKTLPQLKNFDLDSQFDIEETAGKAASWALGYLGKRVGAITAYSGRIVWLIIVMILIPFITFFLLKDGESIRKAAIRIIPSKHTEASIELLQKVDSQIGRYIRGRLAESVILSILTIIGLRILNIKYYLVIGGIAGFANLIPYIGPVAISIPAIALAAYQHGLFRMIITGAFLGGVQIIDNAILIPMVVGKSVDLHPIVTIFVVFVGGQLLGLLGMIIAVPLTSIFIAIFQTLYKELGDSTA